MDGQTLHGLVQRLDRLERENRWLKRIGAVVLAGLAAVILMGQATLRKVPRVVEAEKFILRDEEGRNRAELSVTADSSALVLNDKKGKGGAALYVVPSGARRLELWDEGGPSAKLAVQTDGDSGLRLVDKKGMHRAALEVKAGGEPSLRLADKKSKTLVELFVHSNDTPVLSLYEYDKRRRFIGGIGVAEDGAVMLALNDREEKSHAQLSIPRGGLPDFRFIDKDGKVIWQAP